MNLEIDFDFIDIVYENCDVVRIPANLIKNMHTGVLTSSLDSYLHGKAETNYTCEFIEIEFLEEAGSILTLNDIRFGDEYISKYRPEPFFEHVKTAPNTTHIGILKGDVTLYYIAVPYTDISGMGYRNFYEKLSYPTWRDNPVWSVNKINLRGMTLWRYLKYELRLLPYNYFFRRIKVRIENFFYDIKKRR